MLNCVINTRIFSPNIVAAEAIWFHASGKYSPFLKASIVAEGLENNKSAAKYGLWAAWAADDADNNDVAETCRSKSADLYLSLIPDLDKDSEAFTILAAQTVDIFRRARRWAEASNLASSLISRNINPTVRSVVEFGKALALKEDASRYSLSDVK
jgi:hypothetical protein